MKQQTCLFILLILLLGCNSREKETYIIPDNFEGEILIYFNQEKGKPPLYKDDSRIYNIPKSGILKTQFAQNLGTLKNPNENLIFKYKNGQKIPIAWSFSYIDTDLVVVHEYKTEFGTMNDIPYSKHFIYRNNYLLDSVKIYIDSTDNTPTTNKHCN